MIKAAGQDTNGMLQLAVGSAMVGLCSDVTSALRGSPNLPFTSTYTIHGHMLVLSGLRAIEVLAKCVLSCDRCS